MRIGLILHRSPAYSETFLTHLVGVWEQLGHEVIFIVGWEGRLPSVNYCPALPLTLSSYKARQYVLRVVLGRWWKSPAAKRLYQWERSQGASRLRAWKRVYFNLHLAHLQVDWLHFGFMSAALQREGLGYALQVPLSASMRGADIALLPLQLENPYLRLWPQLNRLHTLGEELKNLAIQQGIPDTLPVHLIPPMVANPLPALRTPRNLSDGPLRILWIGRLTWKKNPELALQVFHELVKHGATISATLIGEGELRGEVEARIKGLGLSEKVVLRGKVSHQEVLATYAQHDVLLHTAWQEGFGNVLLEAQAAGLWVVSTPAEGIRENMVDGVTGELLSDWQVEPMVKAITNYAQKSTAEQAEHAQSGRVRVQQLFSQEIHLETWQSFFS